MDFKETGGMADPSPGGRQKAIPYEEIRKHLCVDLINTQSNADLLAKAPHTEYEDMSMVYRVLIRDPQGTPGRALITNDVMEQMGVTKEELHEDALANSPLVRPPLIVDMRQVLGLVTEDGQMVEMGDPQLYVVSTTDMVWGSAAIFYPGFMDQCTETVGGGFYILPSSIHEVLVYPDTGGTNARELTEMVVNINETQVEPHERLAGNVYHYDPEEKIFESGTAYEERMDAKAARSTEQEEKGRPESVLSDLRGRQQETENRPKPEHTAAKPGRNQSVL